MERTYTETGVGIRETVWAKIYSSLPLDKIIGQPTIKTRNHLREQSSRISAQVKTTEWGGKHWHLALVLHDDEYLTVANTPAATTTTTSQRQSSYHQWHHHQPPSTTKLRPKFQATPLLHTRGNPNPNCLGWIHLLNHLILLCLMCSMWGLAQFQYMC